MSPTSVWSTERHSTSKGHDDRLHQGESIALSAGICVASSTVVCSKTERSKAVTHSRKSQPLGAYNSDGGLSQNALRFAT